MRIGPWIATLALASAMAAPCAGKPRTSGNDRSCTEGRALSVLKRKIVEDVVPEELDFRVTRLGGNYEIKGRYKRPTIGFEPIAKVRIRDCRITDLIWR